MPTIKYMNYRSFSPLVHDDAQHGIQDSEPAVDSGKSTVRLTQRAGDSFIQFSEAPDPVRAETQHHSDASPQRS